MTDEQRNALADLEKALRLLAHGATGFADIAAGTHERLSTERFNLLERPGHPASPADFAHLARVDVTARYERAMRALDAFQTAMVPGPLALVQPPGEDG